MKAMLYRFVKTAFVGAFMLLFSLNASAQDRRVTGKISGADGPLPGANVVLKGTSTGTSTDANGDFTLNVRGANPVLVISAIGSKTQEVTVGNRSAITLTLTDDATALDEVVVTGYTTDTKRETTGAVSTVKAKALTAVPSGNVEQQLQGRVSGLTVITNGQPGTASQVRVRGFGAFGGNEPLYVVDGVPVGSTNFLAPDDIETTTVLKDAAFGVYLRGTGGQRCNCLHYQKRLENRQTPDCHLRWTIWCYRPRQRTEQPEPYGVCRLDLAAVSEHGVPKRYPHLFTTTRSLAQELHRLFPTTST